MTFAYLGTQEIILVFGALLLLLIPAAVLFVALVRFLWLRAKR